MLLLFQMRSELKIKGRSREEEDDDDNDDNAQRFGLKKKSQPRTRRMKERKKLLHDLLFAVDCFLRQRSRSLVPSFFISPFCVCVCVNVF